MQRRALLKGGVSSLLASPVFIGCGSAGKTTDDSAAKSGLQAQATDQFNAPQRLEKFGLQLSTVTPLMLADFEGTLEQVAQIGYQQIEFSAMGFLGRPVERIQQLLDANKLEAPVGRISPKLPEGFFQLSQSEARKVFGTLGGPDRLLENIAYALEGANALGQRYLVLPALMPDSFASLDQVKRNIELMNQAGDLCAEHGVVFGYHNHSWELAPVEGVVPYDLMLQQTDPDKVTFQLDAYWIKKGGGDLFDYLTRFPGRFSSCHMKDIDADGDFAVVGDGLIDFPRFTREALARGAQYFFVERDGPPNPTESIKRSYAYLNRMTF